MVGAILGAGLSAAGQLYSNAQNIRFAREQTGVNTELANTAHQREVRDLRAAGLNPILSAQGGNGAESPAAMNATQENPLNTASQIIAMDATVTQAEAARVNAETNAWQLWDAKSMGSGGFRVMGIGADGQIQKVDTVRINKVTGECFTLDGRRVRFLGETPAPTAASRVPEVKPLEAPRGKGVVRVRVPDWQEIGREYKKHFGDVHPRNLR